MARDQASQFWSRFFRSHGRRDLRDERFDAPITYAEGVTKQYKILSEDFPATFSSVDVQGAVLAFWGRLSPPAGHPLGTSQQTGYWLWNKDQVYLLTTASDGRTRMPSWIGWSEGRRPTHLILGMREPNLSPPRYSIEVYRVCNSNGDVISGTPGRATGPRVLQFEHNMLEGLTVPMLDPALRFGRAFGICYSNTVYRVDKNAGANAWLTVVVGSRALLGQDGEYDLPGGTPSGFYELRAACQNDDDPQGQSPTYPPPAQWQSQFNLLSSDIGCFRWEPNPNYNALDPTSYLFNVYTYTFSVGLAAPVGAPRQTLAGSSVHSTWNDIDEANPISAEHPQAHVNDMTNINDVETSLTTMAARYRSTAEWAWMIQPSFQVVNKFRYRYECTMTTQLTGGGTSADAAHIYLLEIPQMRVGGITVYESGTRTYHDLPAGVTSWERLDEEAWPSFGGHFEITGPAFTQTFRGPQLVSGGNFSQFTVQGDVSRIIGESLVRMDGTFLCYVATTEYNVVGETHYITSALSDFTFNPPIVTRRICIREDAQGRLWISGLHIIGVAF